jgi:hypothetical protein
MGCAYGLGFDVPDDGVQAVTYVERPIHLTRVDFATAQRMLSTKYEHWRYEEEVRMSTTLEEKSGSLYFYNFGENLRLAEIIVGAANRISKRRILQVLGSHGHGVQIVKARLAFDAFRVVEDENGLG